MSLNLIVLVHQKTALKVNYFSGFISGTVFLKGNIASQESAANKILEIDIKGPTHSK